MTTERRTLRFITCGSVDDGKSTLIGRLLHESKSIFDDQLTALENESRQYGTQGEQIDFALLVDGLQAEREQGITIDVAYRFFATENRRFIVADTPGHEQYTRNMATGASTADLAVILIDARKGVLIQTRRHCRIAAMMGIRHAVLAVNKMDLVGFREDLFNSIVTDFIEFAASLNFATFQAIPLSALDGDNVVTPGNRMAWYTGPGLLPYLDSLEIHDAETAQDFRMPVQWVNRPTPDFRGYCGRIAQGIVRKGDRVRILPSGIVSTIKELVVYLENLDRADTGDSITITLEDEIDVSRGDLIVSADTPPQTADQFEAKILWMSSQSLVAGRSYLFKMHSKDVIATVTSIKYREDVDSGAHLAARSLGLNEIGVVNISLSEAVSFEPYAVNRILGGFILIDKLTFETVGAGMINFALRRANNIRWQVLEVNKSARAQLKNQSPRCVWFTGLSGSGKSTIANIVEMKLHSLGRHTYILDGDNIRHGLNRDLGFTDADRVENIRRIAEVAKLMVDAGLIVLVSFISPFRSERDQAREFFSEGEFLEVFVNTSLEECELRDPKGLYAKARRGELNNFTGIDSVYEMPVFPEIVLRTDKLSAETLADQVLQEILDECQLVR